VASSIATLTERLGAAALRGARGACPPSPTLIALRRSLLVAYVVGLTVSISFSQITLTALGAVLLLELWQRRALPRSWPLGLPMLAFAAATVLAAATSARPLESLVSSKSLASLLAFYIVLYALPDSAAAHRAFWLLVAAVGVVAVLSVFQVALCPPEPPQLPVLGRLFRKCTRAHGFYSIYMTFAGVLSLVVLAAAPQVVGWARRAPSMLAAWVACALALAFTQVRGAWVGIVAGVLTGSTLNRRAFAVPLGGLVTALAVAMLASPIVRDRAISLLSPRDDTTIDRMAMSRAGLHMAREHPFLGVGPGQVKHLYASYAVPEALRHSTSHLHNTPVQIMVERGALGLVAWMAMFAAFFGRAVRIWRSLPPGRDADRALVGGSIAAVAGFLVGGVFEYNFGDTEVLLVAMGIMALPFIVERDAQLDRRAGGAV
jgi:O-antigen ligase